VGRHYVLMIALFEVSRFRMNFHVRFYIENRKKSTDCFNYFYNFKEAYGGEIYFFSSLPIMQ
jgi:hypothetical protein